ncbi:MAG: molybdopterin oxidoreductase [SAR324 cluster bacterium]|uniref:Molybdopterin oxidoreductase n=1 Tax=SAR324 cluster bacterium TaxID=2024889 RepID=A0A2A4TAU6_9DELT|nr:MAG: molybdopterin oxidoreductase [SAR324 cluster bacterium]
MTRNDEMKAILERSKFQVSGGLRSVLLLFVGLGIVGFIVGLSGSNPELAWQALLVNTIFFCGVALGGMCFSLIFSITDAQWGRPLKRLAEGMVSFLPVACVLFIVLLFGADNFFEWMDHDRVIHSKAGWLNFPFFVKRNIFMFGLFLVLGWVYLKNSLRADIGLAKKLVKFSNGFADKLVSNYGSQEEEEAKFRQKTKVLSPILAILAALLCTLIAFDWIMSIDQEWFSTMFGVQYLISSLMGAAAVLMIIGGYVRSKYKLESYITTVRYHDVSKLAFSFCCLWTYMIYSQVLVIWYANIPEETPYLILRMQSHEWSWMFWLIFVILFIIPFFGLLSRTACNSPLMSSIVAVDILIGTWLEKYFLVVPSIQENQAAVANATGGHAGLAGFNYNFYDFSITLGVLGLFLLSYFWFLQRVPIMPIADERFFKVEHH